MQPVCDKVSLFNAINSQKLVPSESKRIARKFSAELKAPIKSIEEIISLTQAILLNSKRVLFELDRSFLDRIVASDITNSFRYMFSTDLEAKPYFKINAEACIPPVHEGGEEERTVLFHEWFLHRLNPLFGENSQVTIEEQLKILLRDYDYSKEDAILSAGFQNYGMTIAGLFTTIRECKEQFDGKFLKTLKKFDVTNFEEFVKSESPGSLGTKLCNLIRQRILNREYRKIPAISVLKKMTIGAYAKAEFLLRDEMLSAFYAPDSPYKFRTCKSEGTSYSVDIDPHYKGMKCVVSQKKTYDICKVEEAGLKVVGSFNVLWSFEDYKKICNARLELQEIRFVRENNIQECLEVLRLFKSSLRSLS